MHMAAIAVVMIGQGEAELNGELLPGGEALARGGLTPIVAQPKEGLALVSSNGVAIGAGALVAEEALRLARLADLACALSLEATRGNPSPFDEAAAGAKAIPGQVAAAAEVRALLEGSYLHDPDDRAVGAGPALVQGRGAGQRRLPRAGERRPSTPSRSS